jgi:hypothetical protein
MANTEQHWTAHLEEDSNTSDLLLPFPSEMLDQLGWTIGDTLTWTDNKDGSFTISKKVKE